MSKSYLLINEPPLTVSPTLATLIGLDEAIVIQQVHYWLMNSKNAGRVEEGEKWVYNTYEEWQEGNFPFWGVDKVQRVFLKLEKQGLIISRQFDAKSRNMKKFYRLAYDEICALHDSVLPPSIVSNLHDVNGTENTTENTEIPQNMALEWYIQHDLPIPADLTQKAQAEKAATDEFESALGFGGLPWDSNANWTELRKFIVKVYQSAPLEFRDFAAWRKGEGKYQGCTNKSIRENPIIFKDTHYPTFKASAMHKTDEERGEYRPGRISA